MNETRPNTQKEKKSSLEGFLHGATTFSIMTLGVMTLSMMTLNMMTLSIMTRSIKDNDT